MDANRNSKEKSAHLFRDLARLRESSDALLRHLSRSIAREDLHPETVREVLRRFLVATRSRLVGSRSALNGRERGLLAQRHSILAELLGQHLGSMESREQPSRAEPARRPGIATRIRAI